MGRTTRTLPRGQGRIKKKEEKRRSLGSQITDHGLERKEVKKRNVGHKMKDSPGVVKKKRRGLSLQRDSSGPHERALGAGRLAGTTTSPPTPPLGLVRLLPTFFHSPLKGKFLIQGSLAPTMGLAESLTSQAFQRPPEPGSVRGERFFQTLSIVKAAMVQTNPRTISTLVIVFYFLRICLRDSRFLLPMLESTDHTTSFARAPWSMSVPVGASLPLVEEMQSGMEGFLPSEGHPSACVGAQETWDLGLDVYIHVRARHIAVTMDDPFHVTT